MLRKMSLQDKFQLLGRVSLVFLLIFLVFTLAILFAGRRFSAEFGKEHDEINISEWLSREEQIEEKQVEGDQVKDEQVADEQANEEQAEVKLIKQEQTEARQGESKEAQEEWRKERVSQVEFYFLLKGKSYFKHTLKEHEKRIYNISGYIVSIEPVIITQDSVKFQVNDFTTKALEKKDFDGSQEFEIFVSYIYYRS